MEEWKFTLSFNGTGSIEAQMGENIELVHNIWLTWSFGVFFVFNGIKISKESKIETKRTPLIVKTWRIDEHSHSHTTHTGLVSCQSFSLCAAVGWLVSIQCCFAWRHGLMEYWYVACTLVGEHNADIYLSTSAEQREPNMHLIYMTTPGVRQRQQFGWDATEGGGRREKKKKKSGHHISTPEEISVERWSCLSLVWWEASPRSPLNILMSIFVTVGFFACSQLRGPEHSQFAPSINLFIFQSGCAFLKRKMAPRFAQGCV